MMQRLEPSVEGMGEQDVAVYSARERIFVIRRVNIRISSKDLEAIQERAL
jgi:predicted DNA binding CopG/RHH family protein